MAPTQIPSQNEIPIDSIYNSKIFTFFRPADIIERSNIKETLGCFASIGEKADGILDGYYTSSVQTAHSMSNYYVSCYDKQYTESNAIILFDVTYGNLKGYVSASGNNDDYSHTYNPAKTTYYQYRNLTLPKLTEQFEFAGGDLGNLDFFAIVFKRNQFKNSLCPGRWELHISGSGTNKISLIDNSIGDSPSLPITNSGVGRAYYVCSGSITHGIYGTVTDHPHGLFYPELGIILLNASSSMAALGNIDYSASANLYHDTSDVIKQFVSRLTVANYFTAQYEEKKSSTIYWVRTDSSKYNFSNNPTWQTGSLGNIRYEEMWYNPTTYITTIGLYDINNNLLAVAKTGIPLEKNFEEEMLFKVKLEY